MKGHAVLSFQSRAHRWFDASQHPPATASSLRLRECNTNGTTHTYIGPRLDALEPLCSSFWIDGCCQFLLFGCASSELDRLLAFCALDVAGGACCCCCWGTWGGG